MYIHIRRAVIPTAPDIADAEQKLRLVWLALESGIIYRNPGYICSGCQWANVCAEDELP